MDDITYNIFECLKILLMKAYMYVSLMNAVRFNVNICEICEKKVCSNLEVRGEMLIWINFAVDLNFFFVKFRVIKYLGIIYVDFL